MKNLQDIRSLVDLTPNSFDDMDLAAEKCEIIRLAELEEERPESPEEEEEPEMKPVAVVPWRSGKPKEKVVCCNMRAK